MNSLTITPKGPLRGTIRVPGDKSITHRAFILSALAEGTSVISGYCQGEDCLNTLKALQDLSISIVPDGPNRVKVEGKGLGGLREPDQPLDCGNSGTGLRLLAGVLAGQSFFSILTGDDSLRSRPMGRIANPLRLMGAQIQGRKEGGLAPLAITGTRLHGIHYRSPVSSAQIKSAVLLAGLVAEGETILEEPLLSRDHTERMFRYFGVPFDVEGLSIRLKGRQSFKGKDLQVPGDLSAAAFFIVGASIVPGSFITIEHVGLNPARTGILEILQEMGANIEIRNAREEGGEPVGDLVIRSAQLCGISIGSSQVPKTIDELPIFCIAASVAKGETQVSGAEELRVKETDRIHAMATELKKLNVSIEETPDGFVLPGEAKIKGGSCTSYGDHRVAMAVAIAALLGDGPTIIENTDCIDTSFPGFHDKLLELLTNSN
ncbi:MAG: 3-phosphoshikimate 1-carboxyvinyltransferase [Nitrospirota bacterium]|nr:3-phosphoshikimate 1-carboxyvinyltransferase [Nitrospirota bacterium]